MRQRSGAIVCPECGRLVDVAEEKCPYCGHGRPGLWGFGPLLGRYFGLLNLTSIVVTACILLYVIALVMDLGGAFRSGGLFGFLAPSLRALYTLGMTGGWAWEHGHWWTIASAVFLHGGILHIFFNVMWIRSLGPAVEEIYGPARYFVIFQLAGIGSFLASNLLSGAPTIGASGAIFGMLAALLVHGRRSGRSYLTRQALTWAGLLFLFGFLIPGINNLAHGGGFATGWLVARALGAGVDPRPEGPRVQLLAVALAAFSVVAIVLSIATTLGPAFMTE